MQNIEQDPWSLDAGGGDEAGGDKGEELDLARMRDGEEAGNNNESLKGRMTEKQCDLKIITQRLTGLQKGDKKMTGAE